MRKCPYCAELVRWEANVCRYCGGDTAIAKADKVLYTAGGMLIHKCRNCQAMYEINELEACPNCGWSHPNRKGIIEVYGKQAHQAVCPHCGGPATGSDVFCRRCGQSIGSA